MVSGPLQLADRTFDFADCIGKRDFGVQAMSFQNGFIPPFFGFSLILYQPEVSADEFVGFRAPDGCSFPEMLDALLGRSKRFLMVFFKLDRTITGKAILKLAGEVA